MRSLLETERLVLKELTEEDALFIIELVNTPGWLQFIGDKKVANKEQAILYLQNGPLKSYSTYGFGLWLVALKTTNRAIGMCGLLQRDYLPSPDIGFAFLPAFEGKGYALEASGATLKYALEKLKVQEILAITLPDNVKSIKLLERNGLRFARMIQAPGDTTELKLYQRQLIRQ